MSKSKIAENIAMAKKYKYKIYYYQCNNKKCYSTVTFFETDVKPEDRLCSICNKKMRLVK